MRTRTRSCLLALALLALFVPAILVASGVQAAQAAGTDAPVVTGVSIQLLEIQASQQNDPRATVSIVDRLAPGRSIDRRIAVTNASDTTKTVRLYATAASISGGAFIGSANVQNDLARWTTVDQDSIELAPNDSANLTVSIDIPVDAAEGERYAAIWAEVQSAPDPVTNTINSTRSGLRVYLVVGAGNGAAPDFTVDSLTANRSSNGSPTVLADVTNTGGRAIELVGTLAIASGPGGLAAGPFDLDSPTSLAPGETGQVTVTLDAALPVGPWNATLTLTGAQVTHDRTATLTFPIIGATADAGADAGLLPWLLALWLAGWQWILLGLLLLLGIGTLLVGLGMKLRARAALAGA